MGSGIAAHFANAGLEVLLLDIVPPNLTEAEKKDPQKRNGFAEIHDQVLNEKVVDFLQQHATLEDAKPEAAAPAQA